MTAKDLKEKKEALERQKKDLEEQMRAQEL